MIGRRELMRTAAMGTLLASAGAVSACEYATFEKDEWGKRLIAYLMSGDESLLDELFKDHSTLVAFDSSFIADTDKMSFAGAAAVRKAIVGFRKQLISPSYSSTARGFDKAVLVGSEQQGRMNKIEIVFADKEQSETSCGPTRNETWVDLFYQANVHDTEGQVWSIEHIALMPNLETKKSNG